MLAVDKLTVKDGVVSVAGDAKRKSPTANSLAANSSTSRLPPTGTGWNMKVAPEARAKDVKDYKIVGTSQKRIELPPKLTGEFVYAHDVRVAGYVAWTRRSSSDDHVEAREHRRKLASNLSPASSRLCRKEASSASSPRREWAAIKAAKALKVTWSQPATKMPANADEVFTYLKSTKSLRDQVTVNKGNPDAALAQASKTYEATYRWPFQLHGMMGPSCAVADVGKDQATIYTGTQGSFETRKAVAELLGFPEKERARALSRSLRQLRPHGRRRCRRRCRAAFARSGQTGSRAMDAR